MHLGPDELLVAAKVEFEGTLAGSELAACIDRVEAKVREQVPTARIIYIEPDVFHAPAS